MRIRTSLLLAAAALIVPGIALADVGKRHGDPRGGSHEMRIERFAEYDRDGDGKITADEVKSAEAERFGAVDLNGDGALAVDEVVAMMEQRRRERIEARLARLDRDSDGTVTADEVAAAHTGWFARLDRDGDSSVTTHELRAPRHRGRHGHGGWHDNHRQYGHDGWRGDHGRRGPRRPYWPH